MFDFLIAYSISTTIILFFVYSWWFYNSFYKHRWIDVTLQYYYSNEHKEYLKNAKR